MLIKVKTPDDLVFRFGGDSLWSPIKEQKNIRIDSIAIRQTNN